MGGFTLSIFLLSLGLTFNSALDTLIPQAYGQKDLRLCRLYLNRQLYLTTIVFFILAVPLLFVEQGLLFFYEPHIVSQAAIYVKVIIPGVLFYSWQSCLGRFLSGQGITVVSMYSNGIATFFHIAVAIALTSWLDLGMLGVSIATSLHFFMRFAVTIGYIRFSGKFDEPIYNVPFNDPDNFKLWKPQFIQSLQCMSLSVWSWWAMDVFTVLASNMGD